MGGTFLHLPICPHGPGFLHIGTNHICFSIIPESYNEDVNANIPLDICWITLLALLTTGIGL